MKTIGVLALQGAFKEHIALIESIGFKGKEIRKTLELEDIDALILPGGESTTMGKLIVDFNMKESLIAFVESGKPVWGTCAGMILLAKNIEDSPTSHLNVMDIKVKRNAYGRQLDSFVTSEVISKVSNTPTPLVFIRAPYVTEVGPAVEVLHRVDGEIVAAKQNNLLATSFHPELTSDTTFHEYFANMI